MSWFEGDLVAQVLKASHESVLDAFAPTLVEVLDAQVVIHVAAAEQVVDDDSLRAEVDFCIAAGVDGLVVPALASEFMVLAPEERQGVIATVIDQTGQRVPVVANVAAASLQEAVSYATHAREVGAAVWVVAAACALKFALQ